MISIREKAEAIAREKFSLTELASDEELPQILHELRVHQIELELQNDELRQTQNNLELAQKKYFELYNFAPICYLTFDDQGRVLEINLTGTQLVRRERKYLINKPFIVYVVTEHHSVFLSHLDYIFATKSHSTCELSLQLPDRNQSIQVQLDSIPVQKDGRWVSFSTITDVSVLKQTETRLHKALAEKEILFKEVHHRVKNNLQIINSLLNLQASGLNDPVLKRLFTESQNRIKSMSLIHELLYQTNNLAEINVGVYFELLIKNLFLSFPHSPERIKVATSFDNTVLDLNIAIPCGLILNELVTNALKYAFPNDGAGEILIHFRKNPVGNHRLIVKDNGVGLPASVIAAGESEVSIANINHRSLGLQLVQSLVRQLNGSATISTLTGTEIVIDF